MSGMRTLSSTPTEPVAQPRRCVRYSGTPIHHLHQNDMDFLIEMWGFLRERKKVWMVPLILLILVIGGLLILAEGSVLAPLIYTLF